MSSTPLPDLPDDDEIDLFELWETIVAGKWLILASTLVCVCLATALAFIMTPKYEANVLASFSEEGKSGGGLSAAAAQFGGLAEMAGINLGGGGSKDASFAFLNSRGFISRFIEERNLLPVLFDKKWDAEKKTWKVAGDEIPTMWQAYQLFSKKIMAVSMDKKTSMITLTITWKNREQAVDWANDLIRRANEALRQKTIAETQLSLDYLNKELQKTSVVEVQNTIFRVMESQIKTMMMANTQEQFAFKVIDPAVVVDENAFVQPKRPMMIGLGLFAGLLIGIVTVFIRKSLRNRKVAQP